MNSIKNNRIMNAKLILSAVIFSSLGAANAASTEGYAEALYKDFSAASNNAVSFTLTTAAEGSITELKNAPIMRFIGTPKYVIVSDDGAVEITNVKVVPVKDLRELDLDDLNMDVKELNASGFPIDQGRYRRFIVGVTIGKESYSHQAIELCWEKQHRCFVTDPSVEFVDSIVNGIRGQKAGGYAVLINSEPVDVNLTGPVAKSGVCGLASDHSKKSISTSYSAYHRDYYGSLGLVRKAYVDIGSVKIGMACDASCKPQPFGSVDSSSGQAWGIHSVQCDSASNFARHNGTGRYVGRSGCSHSYSLDASFDLSVENAGSLSSQIKQSATGGVETNGGIRTDTCAFF